MNSTADAINPGADASFDRFMASLRYPDDTISRQSASESVQRFLRDALKVIHAATDVAGDVAKALF
jgi:hypothetical protein